MSRQSQLCLAGSISEPDQFFPSNTSSCISKPPRDFVVSRDKIGEPLSKYGDDEWDFTPYKTAPSTYAIFRFKGDDSTIADLKWFLFLHIYYADSGRVGSLSINSLLNKMSLQRSLGSYSERNGLSIGGVLSSEKNFVSFIKGVASDKGMLINAKALLYFHRALGTEITGTQVIHSDKPIDLINSFIEQLGDSEQTPVIPSRIYYSIIKQLHKSIDDFANNKEALVEFLKLVISNPCYARTQKTQKRIPSQTSVKKYEPEFTEAVSIHGLGQLANRYKITSVRSLAAYLTAIQSTAKYLIHAYSGMRSDEVMSLKYNCYTVEKNKYGRTQRLIGQTTKFAGAIKQEGWITSKEVEPGIEALQCIVDLLTDPHSAPRSDCPLFISVSPDGILSRKPGTPLNSPAPATLNNNPLAAEVIQAEDFEQLEKLQPYHDWTASGEYQVGKEWPLKTHQLRRSLAVYVAQSGLVSLTSLKRQLKHISREMTLYYMQGSSYSNRNNSFSKEIESVKPQADSLAYMYNVLMCDEQLIGGHGIWLDNNQKRVDAIRILEDRDKTEEHFKSGRMAYAETPLGACTTIEPCDKKALRSISACISCHKAVIIPSKLSKVITEQEEMVSELSKESIEFRMETSQLNDLLRLKDERVSVHGSN